MRLTNRGFLLWIGLVMIGAIWQGCTPLPGGTAEPTDELREEVSPLALPTTSETSKSSPLPLPTATPDISPRSVPPNETEVSIPAQAAEAVAWAQADLAAQLNTTTDQISVVSVEFVQWRNSSLGCPQPGMVYAQVITPGYRFLLRAGEKLYEYHSAQGRDSAVLCRSGKSFLPLPIDPQPPADSTQ